MKTKVYVKLTRFARAPLRRRREQPGFLLPEPRAQAVASGDRVRAARARRHRHVQLEVPSREPQQDARGARLEVLLSPFAYVTFRRTARGPRRPDSNRPAPRFETDRLLDRDR